MNELKNRIIECADRKLEDYKNMALAIHERPEVSNYEFFACELLSNNLKNEGFEIELNAAEHRTGFAAYYKSKKSGPVVCFLAEYDALANIGHGCGHNLFGVQSSLAAVCLKEVIDEVGGEIRVYGTPGEEGGEKGSAKGDFVRLGYFNDVDIALCVHPGTGPGNGLTNKNLGCVPIDIEFWGKSSHAAAAPEKGINALDALIMVYNACNALRQQLTSDVKIHGIITNGGQAPNAIPEYAAAKFYLRAAAKSTLEDVYHKVEKIVEGAALQTGCKGSMKPYQNWVENQVPTPLFDEVFKNNLSYFNETVDNEESSKLGGSSDVGNVTQVIPTIQPMIGISDVVIGGHSEEMRNAARSERGLNRIGLSAKTMAMTALDVITDEDLLNRIKQQHKYNVEHQAD